MKNVTLKLQGKPFQIPQDIAETWQTLNLLALDLDDETACQWREVRGQFKESLLVGETPNFDEWRSDIDAILADGGYSLMFNQEK